MILKIPKILDQLVFEELIYLYNKNDNVLVSLPKEISSKDIKSMTSFLLIQKYGDLRNILLADLVEHDNFPNDFLEKVFHTGDTGCRVAICLKKNIPDNIFTLCLQFNDNNVKDHMKDKMR